MRTSWISGSCSFTCRSRSSPLMPGMRTSERIRSIGSSPSSSRARGAVGHLHAEALLAEEELQDLPDVRIVLDHQDLGLLRRADGGDGLGMGHVGLAPPDPGVPALAVRAPGCVSGDAKGVPAGPGAAPRRALLTRGTEKSSAHA